LIAAQRLTVALRVNVSGVTRYDLGEIASRNG
jgi:hypothetical protein